MNTSKTTDGGESGVQSIELFLHQQSKPPIVVDARSDQRVDDLLRNAGVTDPEDWAVFVGEPLVEESDDSLEDVHENADVRRSLVELGMGRTGHLHCYRCRRVSVNVNYQSDTKPRTFPPGCNRPARAQVGEAGLPAQRHRCREPRAASLRIGRSAATEPTSRRAGCRARLRYLL
jgi:hypothetical protein